MPEYIDRFELLKRLEVTPLLERGVPLHVKEGVLDLVRKQPTEDVAPVRHGKWEVVKQKFYNGIFFNLFRCSECEYPVDREYYYCPHCGAKMDGIQINREEGEE